jgi:parallel beta-helix repeat protein
MLILLLLNMLSAAFNMLSVRASPRIIRVPEDYEKIQWAVGNASAGDTILVAAGIYYENVTIEKSLTIVGENKETTIIDGNGTGTGVSLWWAHNVSISGFTIRKSAAEGIYVHCSNNTIISDMIITNNGHGVSFMGSAHNLIVNCDVSNNTNIGIALGGVPPGAYIANTTVINCAVNSNEVGIHVINAIFDVNIINCQIYANLAGISLAWCNVTISGNIVYSNFFGIELVSGDGGNTIYWNDFINNTIQVFAEIEGLGNIWDNGYPSGGNYWSDYTGADFYSGPYQNETGSDGIGDTPYVIDDYNRDNYPFMNPLVHDVAVIKVDAHPKGVFRGQLVYINATVENQGNFSETFDVAVYADIDTAVIGDEIAVGTETGVTLDAGSTIILTFSWDTTEGELNATYTISAEVPPLTSEVDTADNTRIDDTIHVKIPGDVNGNGKVDVFDLIDLGKAYGSMVGDTNWNPDCDFNGDGKVDASDISDLSENYGKTVGT